MKRTIAILTIAGAALVASPAGASTPSKSTVPSYCVKALDAADRMTASTVVVTGAIGTYFAGKTDAAKAATPTIAGVTALLQRDSELTNDLSATVRAETPKMQQAKSDYDLYAARCRVQAGR